MEQNWFFNLIRNLFAGLDNVVYSLIASAYNLLLDIAQFKVFSAEDIQEITGRVYTILGIFMLFKLSFSLINYLVNPDSLTDKQKGIQHVIVNVVVMFAMLILCPWFFEKIWDLQSVILRENFIGALVFGDTNTTTNNTKYVYSYTMGVDCKEESTAKTAGDYMGLMILKGFYKPYIIDELGDVGETVVISNEYKTINEDYLCHQVNKGKVSYYLTESIYNKSVRTSGALWWGKDYYIMNYSFLLSTAVGVVVLLILVGFCMDVGLRVVKLSFLEIIAPIPIISYVDPASGKDGIFKRWTKEVIGTWSSVFIRLLALFFATSIIQKVGKLQWIGNGTKEANIWVQIFVIIGALMFAKQLPSLIEKIFGIKLGGGFNLNPLKKFQNEALGGKQLTSFVNKSFGMTSGLVGGAIAGGAAGSQVGATKRGALLGALGGARNGFKNPKGAFGKGMSEQYKNLTGNEMVRFSLGKMMLSRSGKEKVGETKSYLKQGYTQLNEAQTRLGNVEATAGHLATELTTSGYKIDNYDESYNTIQTALSRHNANLAQLRNRQTTLQADLSDRQAAYTTQKSKIDGIQEAYNQSLREYDEAQKLIADAKPIGSIFDGQKDIPVYSEQVKHAKQMVANFEQSRIARENEINEEKGKLKEIHDRYKEIQSEINSNITNITQTEQTINKLNSDTEKLKRYQQLVKEANDLRQKVSDINRNIETVKKEKTQRERFYQQDDDPKNQNYKKAVRDIENRNN